MDNREASSSKLALGISLLVIGLIFFAGWANKAPYLNSTFENEPLLIEDFSLEEVNEGEIPRKIIIPSLSIDLNIKKAEIIGGYWEVFGDIPAWGTGSGIPGKSGNQVIFAHAREGLFLPLLKAKLEDSIYVFTNSNWYSYKVKEIKEVYPNQVEVLKTTDDETLTLYTCSGFADKKRLVVIAKREQL